MSDPLSSPAEVEADSPPVSHRPPSSRLILGLLALVSLAVAWFCLTDLSRHDPWYDHAEINMANLTDALAINSNAVLSPSGFDQPGLPPKYLLALDYRVRHYLGLLPVWNLKKLGDAPDPLREIPQLVRIARTENCILVMIFILTAAWFVYAVTRNPESAFLTVVLLAASAGLLFQGLQHRPELLCVWFGLVFAPFCAWRATSAGSRTAHPAWLFLAGIGAGLAILTKLPGLYYLLACHAWCWLAAWTGADSGAATGKSRLPALILPIAGSVAIFWLLTRLEHVPGILTDVAHLRILTVATVVLVLPLLAFGASRRRSGRFLLDRAVELAVLGGGALAAFLVGYATLRAVLTEPVATEYLARIMEYAAHPEPVMGYLLGTTTDAGREFLLFIQGDPFLFGSAAAVTAAVCLNRTVSRQRQAFIALQLVGAVAMTWIMAHGRFREQFSIFAQVPLMLVWSFSLFALGVWREQARDAAGGHWAAPPVITCAAVLCLTVFFRLEPNQRLARTELNPPVSDATITFLYDHGARPKAYRQLMEQHYGDRNQFARALERYLADPANR